MNRQVEVADGGTVNQPAGDHDPTGECLGNEERPHGKVDAKFLPGNRFSEEEIEDRDGIHQPSKAGDEPMEPFHIEDEFIFFESHARVDQFELGCLLILCEFLLPGLLTDGRDRSADGIPFDNGKTRTGKADESAEDNEKRHDEGKSEKPVHHGAVFGLGHSISPELRSDGIIASGYERLIKREQAHPEREAILAQGASAGEDPQSEAKKIPPLFVRRDEVLF